MCSSLVFKLIYTIYLNVKWPECVAYNPNIVHFDPWQSKVHAAWTRSLGRTAGGGSARVSSPPSPSVAPRTMSRDCTCLPSSIHAISHSLTRYDKFNPQLSWPSTLQTLPLFYTSALGIKFHSLNNTCFCLLTPSSCDFTFFFLCFFSIIFFIFVWGLFVFSILLVFDFFNNMCI